MMRKGVDLWPRARVGMLAERDDALLLHSDLVDNMQILLDMLMGLNRLYAPHSWQKWLDWETSQLAFAPVDLSRRIRAVLEATASPAAQRAAALVDETFALVERHLPGSEIVDVRAAFDGFRSDVQRPAC